MKLVRLSKGVWFVPDEIVAITAIGGEKYKDTELTKPRVDIIGLHRRIGWDFAEYEDAVKAADYYAELVNKAKDEKEP